MRREHSEIGGSEPPIFARDRYTCQTCGSTGGPRGSAVLRMGYVLPPDVGGSERDLNRLTVCEECHAALEGERPIAQVDVYVARFRRLIRCVTAMQGAVEGYVNCVRQLLDRDRDGGVETYRQAREELQIHERTLRAAVEEVRALPDSARPPSKALRREHREWFDRWEHWVDVGSRFVESADALARAEHSGVYHCPECEAGIWLSDEFCPTCGVDLSPREQLHADTRRLRRRLIRLAQSLDGYV
ncbi:MAG: hypothetical protein ABEJ28_01040 [Salinigranum sp.]